MKREDLQALFFQSDLGVVHRIVPGDHFPGKPLVSFLQGVDGLHDTIVHQGAQFEQFLFQIMEFPFKMLGHNRGVLPQPNRPVI